DGEHFVAIREVPDDSLFYVDILNTKTFGREKRFPFSLELFPYHPYINTWIVKFNAAGNKVAISRLNKIMLLDIESEDTTLFPEYNYRVEVGEFGNNDKYLYYDTNSFYQFGKYPGIYGKLIRRDLETGEQIEIDNNYPQDYPPYFYLFTRFTRSSDRRYIAYEGGPTIIRDIIDSIRIEAVGYGPLSISKDNKYVLAYYYTSDLQRIFFDSPKTGKRIDSIDSKYINFGFLTADNQYLLAAKTSGGMALYKMDYGSSVENQEGTSSQLIADELLYPNPTNGMINLQFNQQVSEITTINIQNSKGAMVRPLFNGFLSEGPQNLSYNISDLATGTYFVQVQSKHNSLIFKLIVER
ncbi:MAG: T9SS type A sorting domain-containing protein, partial [Chloroherpetonaceae bacterium]